MSDQIQFWLTLIGPVVLVVLFMFLLTFLRDRKREKQIFNYYELNPSVLTRAEQKFYASLKKVVGEKYQILIKTRLADIFKTKDGSGYYAALNKITAKHIDFLLCEPDSFEPILGIELDGSSHKRSDRKDRDAFVNRLFEQAEMSLLRVPVTGQYPAEELRDKIAGILREAGRL